MTKPAKIPESKVIKECGRAFRDFDHKVFWRNNSGGLVVGEGKGKRFIQFGLEGSSDWIDQIPGSGRLLACECKRPYIKGVQSRGKLTEKQTTFLHAVRDGGGVAICVDDAEVLRKVLSVLKTDPRAKFDIDGRCLVHWGCPVIFD